MWLRRSASLRTPSMVARASPFFTRWPSLAELAVPERPLDGHHEIVRVERLRHEVVSAGANRGDGRLDACERRHHDHRRIFAEHDDLTTEVDAAHPPHAQVTQHHPEILVGEIAQGGFGRSLGDDLVVPALELGAQHLQHARLVIDDENASVHSAPLPCG